MPQVESTKPDHQKRSKVLWKLVVAVLVLAIAGYFTWRLVPSASSTAKEADVLDQLGKYSESYPKLHSAYGRAITNGDKVLLLQRLAPVTENLGKHDEALKYYVELDHRQPHQAATLFDLGKVAMEQGRKDVALSAFRQVLELEKSVTPGPRTQNDIDGLNSLISQLEGQ